MTVTLKPEIERQARQRAKGLRMSMTEYLRWLVFSDLMIGKPKPDISEIFNLFGSGGSNIRRDKDKMIGEAIAHDVLHKPRRRQK